MSFKSKTVGSFSGNLSDDCYMDYEIHMDAIHSKQLVSKS